MPHSGNNQVVVFARSWENRLTSPTFSRRGIGAIQVWMVMDTCIKRKASAWAWDALIGRRYTTRSTVQANFEIGTMAKLASADTTLPQTGDLRPLSNGTQILLSSETPCSNNHLNHRLAKKSLDSTPGASSGQDVEKAVVTDTAADDVDHNLVGIPSCLQKVDQFITKIIQLNI